MGDSIGWKVTEQILLLLGESCLEGLAGGRQLNHWAWIWVGLGREPALVGLKKGQEEDEGGDRDLALLLIPHLRHRRDRGQEAEQWFGEGHQHSDRLEVSQSARSERVRDDCGGKRQDRRERHSRSSFESFRAGGASQ